MRAETFEYECLLRAHNAFSCAQVKAKRVKWIQFSLGPLLLPVTLRQNVLSVSPTSLESLKTCIARKNIEENFILSPSSSWMFPKGKKSVNSSPVVKQGSLHLLPDPMASSE